MEQDDAVRRGGPRYFNLEPDGFAVLGGVDLVIEYLDPGLRHLLPDLAVDVAPGAPTEAGRRIRHVSAQVLETGVAALVKGLPAAPGGTVDLMLKRIDAEGGRRVLALARSVPAAEPQPDVVAQTSEGSRRFERTGPVATEVEAPPQEASPEGSQAAEPTVGAEPARAEAAYAAATVAPSVQPETAEQVAPAAVSAPTPPPSAEKESPRESLSREAALAAEPTERTPSGATHGSFDVVLEHIGISLQAAVDPEAGLERALRDAAVVLGATAASIMLRRNQTSIVEVVYNMPSHYRGLRFRDDQAPHPRLSREAGDVVAIEDASADDRLDGDRLGRGQIGAVLAVPLVANNERIGVAYFNWSTPQHSSAEQRSFARSLSSVLSPNAQSLRLMRVADREAAYLVALLDAIRAVSEGGLRSSIAAAVLEVLHDRLGLDYGDIRLGADHYRLHTLATLHGHDTLPSNGAPQELGQQAVVEHRVIMGRTEEAPEGRDIDGIRHISIPFEVNPGLVGVMDLSFLGSRRFTPDEMELFTAVGRLLSIALDGGSEGALFDDGARGQGTAS